MTMSLFQTKNPAIIDPTAQAQSAQSAHHALNELVSPVAEALTDGYLCEAYSGITALVCTSGSGGYSHVHG